ncbi:MAG: hypothetical protein KDH09_07300 [Chrysiogenetes bacterium]|nr:hypothetical protein [Chrysiogenetes bacterium]
MKKIAGCDLGKASAKFVIANVLDDGAFVVESQELIVHDGHPIEIFLKWYETNNIASCDALGATGLHADELIAPVVSGLPEDACLAASLEVMPELQGALNFVSVGARGYSVLTRNEHGHVTYVENDKCSSGTGETMVKIAGRFGLSIEEADKVARETDGEIPITARCSVFAKSEMTHFGNQGKPANQLFKGYFGSVARYVAALLGRAQVRGPVYVIGGVSRVQTFVSALAEHTGTHTLAPENAMFFEAIGAAHIAAVQCASISLPPLPKDPTQVTKPRATRIEVLEPASKWSERVTVMEERAVPEYEKTRPAVLGLDLGSTGSKAVLTSIETGETILDIYDRTRGNPVEAASRLLASIMEHEGIDVRAIGATGSGREAVATVLRAAYPELLDRIVVINEIVAHATAAIHCDVDQGENLSVVEIGGQDAKFIQIAGGQIVESDMNKACSAGTGSFLEEQAVFYGVDDIREFTQMAMQAQRPPNLGQMCTVFVAEAASEAHNEGFAIEDLFAGFQYSVIYNYINRVMGSRTFGQRIFFQGKPASGASLAWTLAAVTGREVVVPPNPGAMGAWGIGLCAIKELGREALLQSKTFDLPRYLDAQIVERSEFQCRDKKCNTLCHIDKTTVSVCGSTHNVLSGGSCPKYEVATAGSYKLPKHAPSAFDERRELLRPFETEHPGDLTVGIAHIGAMQQFLPWAATFFKELGVGVKVLQSDAKSLSRGEERCYSFDACAPVKIAHGVCDAEGVDVVFLPKVLDFSDRDGGGDRRGGRTCPMELGMAEMVEQALLARGRKQEFLKPRLSMRGGYMNPTLLRQLNWIADQLGLDTRLVFNAARRAAGAQLAYERALAGIGRRTLGFAKSNDIPAVVVCGSLHVIHDRAVNAGIPDILRQNGVLPIPMDCFPIPEETHDLPRVMWGDANRALRTAVAVRERGDAFPLYLTSFGCGPASFSEQVFAMLMDGFPHTTLESDGHGGQAGFVTRVQAFLHTVRQYGGKPMPVPSERLKLLEPLPRPPITEEKDSKIVMFSMGDRLTRNLAAVYRSFGYDAVAAGPNDATALKAGRKDCSGKECIAYQFIWGSFRKHLEENPPEKRTVLVEVQGNGACRNCMFSVTDQMSINRMGLSDKVALRHLGAEKDFPAIYATKFLAASLLWDILNQLAAYHRPMESRQGQVDELYTHYCDALERNIARRIATGPKMLFEQQRSMRELRSIMRQASEDFAEIASRCDDTSAMRTILLSGDIYVRLDEYSSDNLIRKLNERGLRVVVEPLQVLAEYLVNERTTELAGLPTGLLQNAVTRAGMKRMRDEFYGLVQEKHAWLPMPEVEEMMEKSAALIDRYPRGEAPITVGSVLHAWDNPVFDGIVLASPWGCGPALISEAILKHQRQIPMLFVYNDGSPIDERRLNSFAFRLRREMPRNQARVGPFAETTQGAKSASYNV